jgi:hypothetical protein
VHQVKIFKALEVETDSLETRVNQWLAQTGAKVLSISGNIAPQSEGHTGRTTGLGSAGNASDVLLIILYEMPDNAG